MFEKEIKKVKDRETWLISFGKKDGNIVEGKCFIYYPHEIEEIQQFQSKYESLKEDYNSINGKYIQTHETSKSLEEELNKERETNSQLTSQINELKQNQNTIPTLEEEIRKLRTQLNEMETENNSLETQLNSLTSKHENQQKTLERLEEENSKKNDLITQLQNEKGVLNEERDGLNTTIASMKIQHDENLEELDEKYGDMVSRYNDCVDMIHSLISTTSLLKGDIENMSFSKRTFKFKNNINSLFEERNMNNLIEQHLIHEDSQIPEKTSKKD